MDKWVTTSQTPIELKLDVATLTAINAQPPGGTAASGVSNVGYQPFGPVNGLTYGNVTVGGHVETGGSQLTINGTSSITGSISVSNGTLKLGGSSTGATGINVTGGTLLLAGSSTVSGPVSVSGGMLDLTTAGFIANGWTNINDTNINLSSSIFK